MSMPFRQRMVDCVAPVGVHDLKSVKQADGTYKTVIDDPDLPPSAKFETKNMLKAKIPLDDPRFAEVKSEFIALPEDVKEPELNESEVK